MSVICPAVLANSEEDYRVQIERVAPYVSRVHLDFTDGEFAKSETIAVENAWWPHSMLADLHIMYKQPDKVLRSVIELSPNMMIVHAEAEGNFVEMAEKLHARGIAAGIAILPETPVSKLKPALKHIDHILIFSGSLGQFGGTADFDLLNKVKEIKELNNKIEIGWDGGVNAKNVEKIIDAGVDIINSGGFIQNAKDPAKAILKLREHTV